MKPSVTTRYSGRMVATISDETSVNMLVRPSRITVRLTTRRPLRSPELAWTKLRMS